MPPPLPAISPEPEAAARGFELKPAGAAALSRAAESEPPPATPRAALMEQAPAAPRAADTAPDSEDEHTLMRPATAPLPADAYRESPRTEPEPSVGTALELAIPEPKPSKRRLNLVWLLAAASLCAGGLVVFSAQQGATSASSAPTANAAPEANLPPKREPVPPPPPKTGNLEPPIGTTYDPDTAAEDDALLTPPQKEARKAARARLPHPPRREPVQGVAAEPTESAKPTGEAAAVAPAEGKAAEPAAAQPSAADPAAAAPASVPSEPAATGSAPNKAPAAAAAPTEPGATQPPAAAAPRAGEPPAAGEDGNPKPPAVDRENPY